MPSLKELRGRIGSVKQTQKITSAMKLVAASKLKRAQEQAEASRPFALKMSAMLANLAAGVRDLPGAPPLLAGSGKEETHLIVVATSDRGLCGGFNSTIVRLARARIQELIAKGKTVKILTVGKKGREQLKRDYADLFVAHVDLSEVKRVGYENAQSIARDLLRRYDAGEFDVATIFFNRFQSVISQIPTAQQIIPAPVGEASDSSAVYDYEPSEDAILADLLPRSVATQIFAALLENNASFNGAQMSAMDNATRNAGEMIEKLTIEFNRSRQAVITNELIEIISGAEAL